MEISNYLFGGIPEGGGLPL